MKRNYLFVWVGPLALALMLLILLMLALDSVVSVSHPALSVSTSDVLPAAPEKGSRNWVLLGQPDGADVRTLAVAPDDADKVYVGTADGIFRSSNGGGSWSEALNGQMGATEEILIHPADSNYLYADRKYATSDGGQSWQDMSIWVFVASRPNSSYNTLNEWPHLVFAASKRLNQKVLLHVTENNSRQPIPEVHQKIPPYLWHTAP